jgi:enoyl-CoA hydratase/carnithine racemase
MRSAGLFEACDAADADDAVRAVVLRGPSGALA